MRHMLPGLTLAAALLAAAPLQAQQFGSAAAVGNGVLVIAEPVKDDGPATVYLFRRAANGWVPDGTLTRPETVEERDYFGRFVALDGNTLFVGGTTVESSTGNVWQFERTPAGWNFVGHLRPASVQQGDSYGRAGTVSEGLLFVSSLAHQETGAVWVFRREADGRWVEEALLRPEDGGPQHFFGWSMAYDAGSGHLIVGALTPPTQNRGGVYIFRRESPGQWTREASFLAGESEPAGLQLGLSVAWLDGVALAGAPGAGGFSGEVRTWRRDDASGSWTAGAPIVSSTQQNGAGFGAALAARDGVLLVGAPGEADVGHVHRFERDAASGDLLPRGTLAGLDPEFGDSFGVTIALGPGAGVVGQTGSDYGMGSAVILGSEGGEWRPELRVEGAEPEPLPNLTGEDVECNQGEADIFPCGNVDIRSFLSVKHIGGGRGAETNDVWGWVDPTNGREYAIVGRTDGTAFVDITNPNQPVYLGDLPKTEGSRANAWRDIKVYENHAYVVADGALNHGMQVFDLTRLRSVQGPPVTFDEDFLYTEIASAHNIVINEETGFAYAVGANGGGQTCGGALHMIDIREPKNPRFVGCFADTRTGMSRTGYIHDAQCVVYRGPDEEYQGREICFGANETALSIADVTDKENPRALSAVSYPSVGYAHQGWLTEDHRFFYMNDEGDETTAAEAGRPMQGTRTLIWDVQQLDDPIMVKEHFGETFTIDHNLYIRGDLMYQSNYTSGLRILDISDRMNPRELGFLDTVPWSEEVEFDGSWSNYPFFPSGTIVVSSGKEGVFFVRFNRPLVP